MTLNHGSRPLSVKWDMRSSFARLSHSPISRITAVMLLGLALCRPAVSGPIHDAAEEGDLEKVKALIHYHPDLVFSKDDADNTPLHVAAFEGHTDVAEFLLAHNAKINAKGQNGTTPLIEAALTGNKDVAELLLAHHADVNAKDKDGNTPLYEAAQSGHKSTVALLLAHNAIVNAKNNDGDTPLHAATLAFEGSAEVVELLLAHNADEIGRAHV